MVKAGPFAGGWLSAEPPAPGPAMRRMGIETETAVNVGTLSAGQRRYLDYHRDQIFLATR